jgi:hypothetical protein
MTDIIFITGLGGSLALILGAAWPVHAVSHPAKSTKNWLFAIGGVVMFAYALLNYRDGGSIFFVMLQVLVNISSLLMMLNTSDRFDTPVLTIAGLGMIVWALTLFEGYNTVFFILGLSGIGIGYALDTGTLKRNAALTLGSALIALFSYLEASWIFFWLNIFFAAFSAWHVWLLVRLRPATGVQ